MMMKSIQKLLLLLLLVFVSNVMSAQISDEIKEIEKKCIEKMATFHEIETEMKIKSPLLNGHSRHIKKGDKRYMAMNLNMFGVSSTVEMGFDGTQKWEYDGDTLIITKTTEVDYKDFDNDQSLYNMSSEYKTAKMEEKNGFYEITYTAPVEKGDSSSKVILKINKSNYYLSEIQFEGGLMSSTQLKVVKVENISDDVFVLDLKKYPTAKIVRQ